MYRTTSVALCFTVITVPVVQ